MKSETIRDNRSSKIFNIELIVSIAVAYACVSAVIELYFNAFSPELRIANGIVRNVALILMFIYQIMHYGIKIEGKVFSFFIGYSLYILLYITLFPIYKLDELKMAPSSLINFFFRTSQVLIYILCAKTIIRHFSLKKFLIIAVLFSIIPSLLTIQYIGVNTLQIYGNVDERFSVLPLGYCNGLIIVLCYLFRGKLSSNKYLSYSISYAIILICLFIVFTAGERGPIIWSLVNLIICLYLTTRNSLKHVLLSVFAAMIFLYNIDFVISEIKVIFPHAAVKIEQTVKEGETNGRFDVDNADASTYLIGLNQFASSPLYGSYFRLITNHKVFRGHYPHNVFIEILMTMGLVGFIPFIYLLWKGWTKMKKRLRGNYTENDLVSLVLFLAVFLQLMTSASILFNSAFWCFFYIVCSIDMKCVKKTEKRISTRYSLQKI